MRTASVPRYADRPRHVLHLTLSIAPGGRRDAIITLSRQLRRQGVRSSLAVLRDDGIPLDELGDSFDRTFRIETSGLPTVRTTLALVRHCDDFEIDLLHSHDSSSQFAAAVARCVAPRLQSVMTFHRSRPIDSGGLRNKIRNTISMLATHQVAVASNERKRHLLKHTVVTERKISVLPLGMDTQRFRPSEQARESIRAELGLPAQTPLLVAIGHYGIEKGIDRALRAVARSQHMVGGQGVMLAVLGTGQPDRAAALRQLAADQLGDRVRFLGHRPDVERWMAGADLLVHAPRAEAFGLVLIQAMGCGLPAVAVGVGGIPDIIRHRDTGWLVEPSEDPSGPLAEGIDWLLEHPEMRQQIAAAARAEAQQQYSSEAYGERYLRWYHELPNVR